jgi:6-phosphogluconolactonase (cycloisomerase 2 family)
MRCYRILILFALSVAMLWEACDSAVGGGNGRSFNNGGSSTNFLLYADATAGAVNIASIASTGMLATVGTSTPVGVHPIAMTVTPDGKFVYVLNASSSTVSQLVVGTGGAITQPQSAIGTGLQPSAMAMDPQERFLVVTNVGSAGGATLSVFSINTTTGALTAAGTAIPLTVTNPTAVAISDNSVYVAAPNAIDVLVFSPSTSSFSFAAGSPFSAGPVTTNIAALYSPAQASNRLYAADLATNRLLSFTLSTGALTPGASLGTGTHPGALTANSQNRLLFVANQGSNNISVFTVDATTGAVAPAATPLVSTGTGPNVLAYDSTDNFLWVGLSGSKQIVAFLVNTTTGALTPIGSPFTVTNPVSAMAVAKP